jgi:hypothetical protein
MFLSGKEKHYVVTVGAGDVPSGAVNQFDLRVVKAEAETTNI